MRIQKYKGRELINRGAPLIARIHKGDPKIDPKKPGKDTSHFRIEFEDSPAFDRQRAVEGFCKLYGDNPSVFHNVQFMTDSPEMTFSNAMEEWRESKKGRSIQWRKCDGETMFVHWQGDTCNRNPTPCQHQCGCKPTGRLMFWLPEFTQSTGILGQFMLITHSINDIQSIQSTLDLAFNALLRLRSIAFVLYRRNANITTPDGAPVTKSLVYLEMSEAAAQRLALAAGEAVLLSAPLQTPGLLNVNIETHEDELLDETPEPIKTFVHGFTKGVNREGRTYMLMNTDSGHTIYQYTRKPFIDAGWITVDDWKDESVLSFPHSIAVGIEPDGDYWRLAYVKDKNLLPDVWDTIPELDERP